MQPVDVHVFIKPLSLGRLVRRADIGLGRTTLLSVDKHHVGRYIMILPLMFAMNEVVALFIGVVLDAW